MYRGGSNCLWSLQWLSVKSMRMIFYKPVFWVVFDTSTKMIFQYRISKFWRYTFDDKRIESDENVLIIAFTSLSSIHSAVKTWHEDRGRPCWMCMQRGKKIKLFIEKPMRKMTMKTINRFHFFFDALPYTSEQSSWLKSFAFDCSTFC